MRSRESALFTATAIPAGIVGLGLTAWLACSHADALARDWSDIVLTTLFAVLSYCLSFSTTGRDRASLELSYMMAAVLALPFPAPLIVAVAAALTGSLLRGGPGLRLPRFASVAGANVTVAIGISTAAFATAVLMARPIATIAKEANALLHRGPVPGAYPLSSTLLLCAALFLVMNLVNLAVMTGWVALRGDSPRTYAHHFLAHILPVELLSIPYGCLLAYALRSELGQLGFILLSTVGLLVSVLLRNLGTTDERLRASNHELEQRVGELATLNVIGREISSSLDSTRVFEIVRRECRKVFRPDFFWIARIDPETHSIKVEYSMAGDSPAKILVLDKGEGLTTHIVESETPLLVRDAEIDIRIKELSPIVVAPKIRSILAVPLIVDDRVVGVLSVQSFRASAYDDRHVSLLTTIGQQVAVALENARHYQLATVDQLTGLYQRDYFFQRLADEHKRATRYGASFSLLMLDLDSFKRINDRYGHFAGDHLLRSVGECIRGTLRASDIPCRYGGEEFCVLLPETDVSGASVIAEKIRAEVGSVRVSEGPHRLGTTLSIGIASFPVHFEGSLPGLLQKADLALYAAKKEGKDRVVAAA